MLLRDLIEQAHSNSKAKGWWDGVALPLTSLELVPEKLALIHSEISEALECFRDGEMALEFTGATGSLKPVGFPSELADVVIRCADLLGALKDPLWKGVVRDLRGSRSSGKVPIDLAHLHRDVSDCLTLADRGDHTRFGVCVFYVIGGAVSIATKLNIDLEAAIVQKMAYNSTRPHRHWGKAC